MGSFDSTSWAYLANIPLLILSHEAAPLIVQVGRMLKEGSFFHLNRW